ncbi:hypothetical protein P886_2032 [Alteromonadaceae bacterium 2753L.S.0a.02]|nr:hypothetical protein P886_2032 [Alteromonadaceae bacterium 2753L.S.0a.02]
MDDLLKFLGAGGDLGTWAIVYVYVKHSGILARIQAKIEYIENWISGHRL